METLSYADWHARLLAIGELLRRNRKKPGAVLPAARAQLDGLLALTRDHTADSTLASARVPEAVLWQEKAALERLAGQHLYEAAAYEREIGRASCRERVFEAV